MILSVQSMGYIFKEITDRIYRGKYTPSPVRRVEIPKPDGGVRKLGIPTVVDRTLQQAITQQLVPIYEPLFAEGSYGYRPNRSAKDTKDPTPRRVLASVKETFM